MIQNKVLALLGLAMKAGKLVSGEFSVEKSLKEGSAFLVIIAEESSNNTKKNFRNMCTYYQVPIYFFSSKSELGHAIGKEYRASLAVLDEGFAKAIEKQVNDSLK